MLVAHSAVVNRPFGWLPVRPFGRHVAQIQPCRLQNRARLFQRLFLALPVMLFEQFLGAVPDGAQVVVL